MRPSRIIALTTASCLALAYACTVATDQPVSVGFGPSPTLPEPETGLLPTVNVAEAERWPEGTQPTPAEGYEVTEFAAGLDHPRWLYQLPNGDVLVAETNAPPSPEDGGGLRGYFMDQAMEEAGAGVESANRISLLRDTDGDGRADQKTAFLTGLHSPFGMALLGDTLYVANTDAIVSVPYEPGQTEITATPTQVFALPAGEINHHWTKNIVASPDGERLYAAVGSNSNVAENGLDKETGRAAIWEIDLSSGEGHVFADGLRNPVGMDFSPDGELFTVVNERDELGDNLVPDYLTSVSEGEFFGWPFSYFGDHVDPRMEPADPEIVARAIAPDYALGAHTASLGLDIVDGSGDGMRSALGPGAYIGQHGSWNRDPRSGYKVIFIPFSGGMPAGESVTVLEGFLDGDKARGRPVGVLVDQSGGLLVADDVGNRIWRVTKAS